MPIPLLGAYVRMVPTLLGGEKPGPKKVAPKDLPFVLARMGIGVRRETKAG